LAHPADRQRLCRSFCLNFLLLNCSTLSAAGRRWCVNPSRNFSRRADCRPPSGGIPFPRAARPLFRSPVHLLNCSPALGRRPCHAAAPRGIEFPISKLRFAALLTSGQHAPSRRSREPMPPVLATYSRSRTGASANAPRSSTLLRTRWDRAFRASSCFRASRVYSSIAVETRASLRTHALRPSPRAGGSRPSRATYSGRTNFALLPCALFA
jgi:hypothetical protein